MGESKRDMVLSELITTESAYVEDLQAIHTYYVKPSASSNCLKHSEWSTLFANLPELTTVNRLFLKQLVTVDDYETLGKLFVAFAPEFACYEVYIVQVEDAFKLIREKEKNTAFQSFLNDCHIKSHQALGLETYLLKPLQRLLKYPLLLGEILKRTPEQNTNEREALEEALEQMKILSLNVNEAKRDKEKYEELVAMRRHVDGWDDFKLSANDTGPFILDGDVKIVTRSGSLKSFKVRHLMLFQKYILICKPARFFDSYNYILREKLDLGTMKIKDMMDEGNLENAWSVSCSFGKRTFFHDSYEEKEKWMSSVVVELFKITGGDSGRSSVTSSNQDLANAGEMSKEDLEKEIQIARNTRKGVQNLLNTYTQQSSFGDMEARKALEVNLQNLDNKLSELNAMYEKYTVGQTVDEESDEWSDFSSDDDDDDWRSVDGGNSSAATSVYDMRLSEPELFVAVYSFTGESEKDLSFEEGDYLYVLEKQDEDGGYEWWLADKDGEQGYVPSTYITPYVDESENPTENEWVEGGDLEQRKEEGYGEHYELEKNEQTRYDLPCEVEQNDFGEQPYQTDEGVAQGYEQSYETEQNDYYHGEQYQQEEGYNENDRSYYEEASGNYADGNEYEMNPAGDVEQHIEPRQPDYGNFDSYEDEWGDNNEDENNPQASASVTKDYYYQDPVQPEAPVAVNAPESVAAPAPEPIAAPAPEPIAAPVPEQVAVSAQEPVLVQEGVPEVPVSSRPAVAKKPSKELPSIPQVAPEVHVESPDEENRMKMEDVVSRVMQTSRLQKQMALLTISQKNQTSTKFGVDKEVVKERKAEKKTDIRPLPESQAGFNAMADVEKAIANKPKKTPRPLPKPPVQDQNVSKNSDAPVVAKPIPKPPEVQRKEGHKYEDRLNEHSVAYTTKASKVTYNRHSRNFGHAGSPMTGSPSPMPRTSSPQYAGNPISRTYTSQTGSLRSQTTTGGYSRYSSYGKQAHSSSPRYGQVPVAGGVRTSAYGGVSQGPNPYATTTSGSRNCPAPPPRTNAAPASPRAGGVRSYEQQQRERQANLQRTQNTRYGTGTTGQSRGTSTYRAGARTYTTGRPNN